MRSLRLEGKIVRTAQRAFRLANQIVRITEQIETQELLSECHDKFVRSPELLSKSCDTDC